MKAGNKRWCAMVKSKSGSTRSVTRKSRDSPFPTALQPNGPASDPALVLNIVDRTMIFSLPQTLGFETDPILHAVHRAFTARLLDQVDEEQHSS